MSHRARARHRCRRRSTARLPWYENVAVEAPVGNVSVITTLVAMEGPPLVTAMAYLVSEPSATGSTLSPLLTMRSTAAGVIVVVAVALLLALLVSAVAVAMVTLF